MENEKTKLVTTGEAILVIVATFFIFLFVSVAIQFEFGSATALIVGELIILAVPLIYLLSKGINIVRYIGTKFTPKYIAIGLGCAILLLLLNIAVSNLLVALLGESAAVEESNRLLADLSTTPSGFAAVATSLTLAGICEEFAFRGFLQNSIFKSLSTTKSSKYSFVVAILISSIAFGFVHFDPQFVYSIAAFITGLALGLIYHRWNYTVSAIAHASMNLIVLALLLFAI